MMNYNHLYYFYLTAKMGSVTAAANALRIAQPSLSGQIKLLEKTINRALVCRAGRNIKLTPEGEFIYEYCKKIFQSGEELESIIQGRALPNPRLHLGVCEEVERPFVVEVVGNLFKQDKEGMPQLTLISNTHSSLITQLQSRILDAVITNYPTFEEGIEVLSEYSMPVLAIHHPETKFNASNIRHKFRNQGIRWVLPHRKLKLRSEINSFMEGNVVRGQILLESDVLASLVRAVLDGIGTAFFPLPYVQSFIRQERLVATGPKSGFWKHQLWLVTNPSSKKSNLLRTLKNSFDNSVLPYRTKNRK